MKKSYIKPEIKVESAKLAAFCSGACLIDASVIPEDLIEQITSTLLSDGICYCYHGVAGSDFSIFGS